MNAGKPQPRDWRAQPPVQSLYSREWRNSRGDRPERFSRKFKLRVVVAGLIALVALIVIMLAPAAGGVPPMQILTFGIGAYGGRANPQGNMPVNPFGEQDAGAFQVLNEIHPAQFLPVRKEDNALSGGQFLSFLQTEADSPALNSQNLLVFCTLHGIVEPSGEVELFAIDATPESPGSSSSAMIRFKDLVARLQQSRARRVLLVLDAARLATNWKLGILNNDIAAQLASDWPSRTASQKRSSSPEADKVTILLSAGVGQQSWLADNESVLVQFLLEGLNGAADGWEGNPAKDTGNRDRRVSLRELSEYLRQQIEEWTRKHCGIAQTVQVLGNDQNFDLAIVSPTLPTAKSLTSGASSLKASTLKPPPLKVAAIKGPGVKAAKSVAKKEKSEPAVASDAGADEKHEASAPDAAVSVETADSSTDNASETRWNVRLEELRKARDEWQVGGRQGRHEVCRQMPLTWRTFESQLALATALQSGGLNELTPQALLKADIAYKKLQSASSVQTSAELSMSDSQRQALHDLGFSAEANVGPQELAKAGKYLLSLLKEAPAATDTRAASGATQGSQDPDPSAIQSWMRQELFRDVSPENWNGLKQITDRLLDAGRLPQTLESQLLRELLSVDEAATRFGDRAVLQRVFTLRDRYRRLAGRSPESLPLIRETVLSGMRSLSAAERWLLATDARRSEVRDWLDKADESANQAELSSQRYLDAIGIWSDLLAEFPAVAEWIATRANDDDHRKDHWTRLRELSRSIVEREHDGRWDAEAFRNLWPDKPARLADLERLLLVQFVNAQRLKIALLKSGGDLADSRQNQEDLPKLVNQAVADRRDFWEEIQRSLPRLGTADRPTPSTWREAYRLRAQSWLSDEERRKLGNLLRLEPRGNPLPDRSSDSGALWQGFWAVASISLLSNDPEITAGLWKDWERLTELSITVSATANPPTSAEQDSLRKRRSELGSAIRQQFNSLQNRAQVAKSTGSLPLWHLIAATVDPTLVPESDPDLSIRDERKRQFVDWLTLFVGDWRSRSMSSTNSDPMGYVTFAERAETLLREFGSSTPQISPRPQFQVQDEARNSFDAERLARLKLSVSSAGESSDPLKVLITGSRIRVVDGSNQTAIAQTVVRPVSVNGQLELVLKLEEDVDVAQPVLLVLTEASGYPLDFRRIMLYPPFDPKQWRIEFVEAKTNTVLEHVPLSEITGTKVFLPPMAGISLRANLVRPLKDLTPAAKISIFRLTESSRVPLVEEINLKLEAGKAITPILFDLPAADKDKKKEAEVPKDKLVSVPIADLARGWLFEITPEAQKPLEYQVRPTFWSAAKFIREPQPNIRDDRLTMELERRPATAEDVLLPEKIRVDLSLPDALQNSVTDYTLGGSVAVGQKQTLSFGLPKNWSDLARERNLTLALDVAGLPHAHRWRIESSGNVTPVPGQPPQVNIRLFHPPVDPQGSPRFDPVIRKGKESLNLRFLVDATELDRSEERGDWTLSYTIARQGESGSEPTPLQNSWRLFSSVQRHVLLDSIQAGVWNFRTFAQNYSREEPESEIRGLSGRFQVQAMLARTAQPSLPLATGKLLFAIDDDAPPAIEVKGLNTDPRPTDKDLSFRIQATDLESGIQRLVFGFDKNGDKQLQEDEEAIEEHSFNGLENPKVDWPVIIGKGKLPALKEPVETRNLIVQARNSLGIVGTRVIPVAFRKPTLPKKMTTGTLVVKLAVSRGSVATIQLTGPESRLEDTKSDSLTFSDLPPGQYQIGVKVIYAVVGQEEKGDAKVDVKVGMTTTAKVPLSVTK